MTVAATLAGVLLVAIVARDVFDTLFHSAGRGSLGRVVASWTWAVLQGSGRRGGRAIAVGGPLALALVIVVWAVLLVAGFALLYLPHVPGGFTVTPDHAGDPAALLAVSFSLVTLSTLGYGDITPSSDGLQLLAPLQALVGFGLLSASIAWLLSIHPVLARRRSLAYDVTLLARAEREAGVTAEEELEDLHRRVIEVERDLHAYPITFYFAEGDARFSLAAALPVLAGLVDRLDTGTPRRSPRACTPWCCTRRSTTSTARSRPSRASAASAGGRRSPGTPSATAHPGRPDPPGRCRVPRNGLAACGDSSPCRESSRLPPPRGAHPCDRTTSTGVAGCVPPGSPPPPSSPSRSAPAPRPPRPSATAVAATPCTS
jgi:hypothetical protein